MRKRYLVENIIEDTSEKMVFIAGPRQVGKTTLALSAAQQLSGRYQYLSWDNRDDRNDLMALRFHSDAALLIFDEIHKYRGWKNFVKGVYDSYRERFRVIVTGSAMLDLYRRGGDSLMGRYHLYRLHPFSYSELLEKKPAVTPGKTLDFNGEEPDSLKTLENIKRFGGFP
ncbi:MAG: AAA family ATPase [Candidatus Eremiobacteraeota bacterium]|nr:AAA family ATPase [Candidatus Eremiobacteraeota bacterium]